MSTLIKIRHIFNRTVKIKLIILLMLIIVGALLETIALSVIYPFISVILDSSTIENNSIPNFVSTVLNFKSIEIFLAFLSFFLAFIYAFRGIYMYILSKIQYKFLSRRQIELSNRLLKIILNKSYLYHANKNLAELQRNIVEDAGNVITLVLSVLMLISDFFMSFFIFVFLLIVSTPMTLVIVALSFTCVVLYFKFFRAKIKQAGDDHRIQNIKMWKAVIQALGGIKELKVFRRENYFINEFKTNGDDFVKSNQRFHVYNAIPKLLIEAVCFGGAFILIGIFVLSGVNMEFIVPQLSLFVLASFRLLPATARFTGYVNQIIFNKPSVDAVYNSIFENYENYYITNTAVKELSSDISNSSIVVDNLTFQYPNTETPVLKNIYLSIPNKKSVALIGSTGAGKTTLADIILGIYTPQNGEIFYNGKSIHHDLDEWSKRIGYVPQHIYLLDETIIENIAFGIPRNEIDEAQVWNVIEKAQIKEFVISLPEKLYTIVGDKGIRLSGGQRQRIGIARALYANPDILILDEATSALDHETEKAIMEAIETFKGEKTMIIIAHRLSTIEHCDIIYRIEDKTAVMENNYTNKINKFKSS